MEMSKAVKVSATSTGGADVDVKLVLFVDGQVKNDDCISLLADLHTGTVKGSLGPCDSGNTALSVFLAVAPRVDGQFRTTITLTHPGLPGGTRILTLVGDTAGGAKVYRRDYKL